MLPVNRPHKVSLMSSSYRPNTPSRQPNSSTPSSRFVYPHHLRDLKGAVGASIGKGFDVLSRQLHTLNRKGGPRNK